MNLQDIAVVVPMRGGSKRLPNKHKLDLNGKTLPEHTAAMLRRAGLDGRVWLSTDDPELAEAGLKCGWHVPSLRPAELAEDASTTVDVILHALDHMIPKGPEIIMVAQATSPFCPHEAPGRAYDMLQGDRSAASVLAVKRQKLMPRHYYRKALDESLSPLVETTDDTGPIFTPTGALYAVRKATFLETKSLTPARLLPLEIDDVAAVDIDTREDWAMAAAFAAAGLTGKLVDPSFKA